MNAPPTWEGAAAFAAEGGRIRYLIEGNHGIALLETDAEVLRDWPHGDGIDYTSSEEAPPEPEPESHRPTGPLTPDRVDDAFGERHVLRIPESDLPEGLEHPGSRRHLRDIGLPALRVCHGAQYEARPTDAMRPASDGALSEEGLPEGVAAADLIVFGACEYGELYLHRHDGTVRIWSGLQGPTKADSRAARP